LEEKIGALGESMGSINEEAAAAHPNGTRYQMNLGRNH
jgi:hypothetical protein